MKSFTRSYKQSGKKLLAGFSALLVSTGLFAVVSPVSSATAAPVGAGFTVTESDLAYILDQIKIAEAHRTNGTATASDYALLANGASAGNVPNVTLGTNPVVQGSVLSTDIPDPQLMLGLRQVDGRNNNLTTGFSTWNGYAYLDANQVAVGKSTWGAADQPFKRTVPANWKTASSTKQTQTDKLYSDRTGSIYDTQPRVISNLISDQTDGNPAATAAAPANAAMQGDLAKGTLSYLIPNRATNAGISASANGIFSLFGQFFDHGLDLVGKSGTDKIRVCLNSDDPLVLAGKAAANSCMSTGRSVLTGTSGTNATTPWVDQNQTYTSHPSKQVFLREYTLVGGKPVSTGKLLDGAIQGNIATWADTKRQAESVLGIRLLDTDIFNVPLLLTDEYGRFLRGPRGLPQVIDIDGSIHEGNTGSPISVVNARRTGHAFLDDINPYAAPNVGVPADADSVITVQDPNAAPPSTYDNELLDAHFITGDGRGNENIGLTAIHSVFHSEHNRLVDDIMNTINLSSNATLRSLVNGFGSGDTANAGLWNTERLFHAARFVNEMEYQHIVFGEFARKVQPAISAFAAYNPTLDPTITEEFANAAYRYGHSQLDADINRVDGSGNDHSISLFDGFLNPVAFNTIDSSTGVTAAESTGQIMRGMSSQVGNEIDEFITSTLRNTLLGAPLDLATLNIARARDAGLATLNQARAYYSTNGNATLTPYDSWYDFGRNLQHPESLVNFIAAYGKLDALASAKTLVAKRSIATKVLDCAKTGSCDISDQTDGTNPVVSMTWLNQADAKAFLGYGGEVNSATTGVDDIDLWIGGLAEAHQTRVPAASMLGSTLDFIFKTQLENLQESDRFYYLGRTAGMNLAGQLETNFFSELVMRNANVSALPADAFAVPDYTFDMSKSIATYNNIAGGTLEDVGGSWNFTGNQHVVFDGTSGANSVKSGGGNDTLRGNDGDDTLEGGFGDDFLYGGLGNDIMSDTAGADIYIGGPGNDYMAGGAGLDTFNGGSGLDFIVAGNDPTVTLAGEDDDFVLGGTNADGISGEGGNDWLDGGNNADSLTGDLVAPFVGFTSSAPGDNVLIGGANNDLVLGGDGLDINLEGQGTDSFTGGFGFDWSTSYDGSSTGVSVDLGFAIVPAGNVLAALADTFLDTEGASGGNGNDNIIGDLRTVMLSATPPFTDGLLSTESAKIDGLRALIAKGRAAGVTPTAAQSWLSGNILLGGNGSDTLTGLAGDDRIDGDAYLQVGLAVPIAKTGAVLSQAGTLVAGVSIDPTDNTRYITQNVALLRAMVKNRVISTTDIVQVKTIQTPSVVTGIDTAVFANASASYTITYNVDGSITVADNTNGGNNDGVDTLTGIEILRFADVSISLGLASNVVATPANASAIVTWSAPASAVSNPVANYTVTAYSTRNGGNIAGVGCSVLSPLSCVITGLANGTRYFVEVSTTSSLGTLTTARFPVTPIALPDAPTGVTATLVGSSTATVFWTAAATPSGNPITGYTVLVTRAGSPTVIRATTGAGVLSSAMTGLTPSTTYNVTVQASNRNGVSPVSAAMSFTTTAVAPTPAVPSAPVGLTAVSGSGSSVQLRWTAPTTNFTGVTYAVSVAPAAGTVTCASNVALTCNVTGLVAGTRYTFRVVASNVAGSGVAAIATATPTAAATTPGPVTGLRSGTLRARTAATTAQISWAAPVSNGSNAATSYVLSYSGATTGRVTLQSNVVGYTLPVNVGNTTVTVVAMNGLLASTPSSITITR